MQSIKLIPITLFACWPLAKKQPHREEMDPEVSNQTILDMVFCFHTLKAGKLTDN